MSLNVKSEVERLEQVIAQASSGCEGTGGLPPGANDLGRVSGRDQRGKGGVTGARSVECGHVSTTCPGLEIRTTPAPVA